MLIAAVEERYRDAALAFGACTSYGDFPGSNRNRQRGHSQLLNECQHPDVRSTYFPRPFNHPERHGLASLAKSARFCSTSGRCIRG
ncbi:hypothetical protein MLD38_013176 [Melastoma candidum]|uniref:Uncharacterized protein n=1 Tax=Melastoma candidum TaxID=119954 RepID=A0ACB9RCD3_9MYRT|nr:hypothetical protein MLD38_013176 [Melastoma candidum]